MKKRFLALFALLAFFMPMCVFAQLEYLQPDLSQDNVLLFGVETRLPDQSAYRTLFLSDLGTKTTVQMTVFPESISLIDEGRRFEVRNRFGLFRSDASQTRLSPVSGFASFVKGMAVKQGQLLGVFSSPDGAFIVSVKPTSPAYASLVLFEVSTEKELLIASQVEYSPGTPALSWSPDSQNLAFSKSNNLYYFSISQYRGNRILEEENRKIGRGALECLQWGADGSIFYLDGSSLFRIQAAELFTRALFIGYVGVGHLLGTLPFTFDPNFDRFWISSNGERVFFVKGGRSLFLMYTNYIEYGPGQKVSSLPYLLLQMDATIKDVIWPDNQDLTIFVGSMQSGSPVSLAFRIVAPPSPGDDVQAPRIIPLEAKGVTEMVLSPGQGMIALVNKDGVTVRNYSDWSVLGTISAPGALHCVWSSDSSMIVAGTKLIERVNLQTGAKTLVALSSADNYARSTDGHIAAVLDNRYYFHDSISQDRAKSLTTSGWATAEWNLVPSFTAAAFSSYSSLYRVYLDKLDAGSYKNVIMLRSITGAMGTVPIFEPPVTYLEPQPRADDVSDGPVFDHGSRVRGKEIALVFNVTSSIQGLIPVLNTLMDSHLECTFFVNGEFIRRYPQIAQTLAQSRHEIGSMFTGNLESPNPRIVIDKDYIRRGLASNEDDWFAATGKEISLIWHAPYYTIRKDMLDAGRTMNYLYIGRDIDPMDWFSREDAFQFKRIYLNAHAIVEKIMAEVKPGSIIPIQLGLLNGERDDYLFNELPLLIDSLVQAGYRIVPVSTLIKDSGR